MRPSSAIRARRSFALVLAAGAVAACDEDVTGPLEPTAFAAVTVGGAHTCALNLGAIIYCWGEGAAGELGDGRFDASSAPRAVRPAGSDPGFVSLSAGFRHTCAVTVEQDLFCWGWNFYGQLGNASTVGQGLPIQVGVNLRIQQVTSGWFHTCALTASADAYCWGSNGQGQLGDGSTTSRTTPARVAGGHRFARLSAGGFHTCGVTTAGAVHCWGLNHQGQLGTGDVTSATQPRPVEGGGRTFTDISAGYTHTCAVDAAGTTYCWGSNGAGELGAAFASEPGVPGSTTPAEVFGLVAGYLRVDAGLHFTCAVRVDGPARCWGLGLDGQLGTGGYTSWVTPQPVAEVNDFESIEAGGGTHACGITRASAILCWGRGDAGQLGNPTTLVAPLPARVPGVT